MVTIKNAQAARCALLLASQLTLNKGDKGLPTDLADQEREAIAREYGRLVADGRYTDNVEIRFTKAGKRTVADKDVADDSPDWLRALIEYEHAARTFIKKMNGELESGWQGRYRLPIPPTLREWLGADGDAT